MTNTVQVFNQAPGEQESVLRVKTLSLSNSRHPSLLDLGAILRVDALGIQLMGGFISFGIKTKNRKQLLRPDDFSGADVPMPTSSAAKFLRFSQVCLATPQSLLGALLFAPVKHESDPLAPALF